MDERMDQLISRGVSEMILVFPDCFTRYGGSQYLDSSAVGLYRTHLLQEIIPAVDGNFRTRATRRYRAVLGKSSGGYGAITLGMEHPELFSAVACHSGDMYFEYCYLSDIAPAMRRLEKWGGLEKVLRNFDEIPKTEREDHALLNIVAMSACYSPRGRSFDLPFDEKTGELRSNIWKKWKRLDPVEMLKRKSAALKKLGFLYLDCGKRDEFALNLGARIFSRRLTERNIHHVYAEFEGGHFNVQHRYDVSLRLLGDYFSGKKK